MAVALLPHLVCSAVDLLPFAAVHHKGLDSGSQLLAFCCRLLNAVLEEAERKAACTAEQQRLKMSLD